MSASLPLLTYSPWSPSKADLASRCALAFKFRYIDKLESARKGSPAKIGTTVHRAQELVLQGEQVKEALDTAVQEDEDLTTREIEDSHAFAQSLLDFKNKVDKFKSRHSVEKIFLERKLAITPDFDPCEYDDPQGMIRGIVDMALLLESGHLIIIDHKSGRKKPVKEFSKQLNIYTVIGYAHHPEVIGVQGALNFMAHDEVVWGSMRPANYIKTVLQPWLIDYLNDKANSVEGFNPSVGRHCKWCDYRRECPEVEGER